MARFMSVIVRERDNQSEVHRLSHHKAETVCMSYGGQVRSVMRRADPVDHVTVTLEPHGGGSGITLYDGPVDGWKGSAS